MKSKKVECAYVGEMKRRSWAKSITWRIIGIVILGAITWLITNSWEQTSLITITFHGIRLFLYYLHERWWDNCEWGRIKFNGNLEKGEGI
ncbi:MAG: hypothetical protein A2Z15_04970 [Chloroflexi bacterium RBG_16_50_11]|nr:MAG: hypothetical protein A2Z15_04970 [Chloroflexi bacterium RBG_16_50_11]